MNWIELPAGATTGTDWCLMLTARRVDPYLVWFDAIGFRGFNLAAKEPLVVQIELDKPLGSQLDGVPGLELPSVYRVPLGTTGTTTRFLSARVPRDQLAALMAAMGVLRVQLEMSHQPKSRIRREPPADALAELSPERIPATWLGIIDDGCAFAHADYRAVDATRSRVRFLWDQSRSPDGGAWTTPARLGYGAELAVPVLGNDERKTYDSVRMGLFADRRATHGCGVMNLLAGHPAPMPAHPGGEADAAGTMNIAFVQLPPDEARDICCAGLGVHVLDGLRYLVDSVERFDSPNGSRDPSVRLVINLSYGSLAGPHDGSTILERAMDELISARQNLAIVLAAGNTIDPQRPTHVLMHEAAGAPLGAADPTPQPLLRWRIQPDDATDSYLEIWFDEATDLDALVLRVTPPGGQTLEAKVGTAHAWQLSGVPVAGFVFPRRCSNGDAGTMALLALVPVAPADALPGAPSGAWTIELISAGQLGDVHAWIERDDLVAGQTRQRQQSWFDGTNNPETARQYSLSSIAHGRWTLVAAGRRLSDDKLAESSASGPSRGAGPRLRPDFTAPSERGPGLSGLLVAGTQTGIVNLFSGTSAAAPSAARWVADWFECQPPGTVTIEQLMADLRNVAVAVDARDYRTGPVFVGP